MVFESSTFRLSVSSRNRRGDFNVNIDAVYERAADLLLVAGDGYGGRATFFDGGVVEAAGRSVLVAVVH